MLIVTGIIEVAPGRADVVDKAVLAMVEETRKEAGCFVYEFSRVLGSETRLRVYEEWLDEAALNAHGATPHMAAFRAALGTIGIVSRDISKFEAGEKTTLG